MKLILLFIALSLTACTHQQAYTPNIDARIYTLLASHGQGQAFAITNAYYQKALQLDPKSGEIHNNYGVFLCRHKKYHLAIQQFLVAMHTPHYVHRALAHANLKQCQQMLALHS